MKYFSMKIRKQLIKRHFFEEVDARNLT